MNLPLSPIDLAREADFMLGPAQVRPALRLFAVGGADETIEPRVMQVLVALAQRRVGEVVGRDELVALCWEGRVIGEDAIQRAIAKVRRLGEQSNAFTVETIPKVGYRLKAQNSNTVASASTAVLSALALPDKPSIAVLPFGNLSDDPGQQYFADGMVDEITTALTRFASLFVIANSSTLAYRSEARDLKQIARELGVRYLLEGSVRKSGSQVRIAVKLTDAIENLPLWSERFDGTLEDVFALQDQVANAVAAQIEPTIEASEIRRANSKPTQDLDAHDLYLRALHLDRRGGKDASAQALALLNRAIVLDSNYALAMSLAGRIHLHAVTNGWSEDQAESRRISLDLVLRARRADANDPIVLARAATAMIFFDADLDAAETLMQRALALCPGASEIWMLSGSINLLFPNRAAECMTHLETALRLDPRSPRRHNTLGDIGVALIHAGRYDEAIPLLRQLLQMDPEAAAIGWMLVFALAATGRTSEAGEVAHEIDAKVIPYILRMTRDTANRELLRSTLAQVLDADI